MYKTGRIPRKQKKQYKKLWEEKHQRKIRIVKRSIAYKDWGDFVLPRWGCTIIFLKQLKSK